MKLSTREDIDRPIAEVFAAMADFEAFEKRITARGIALDRRPGAAPPETGAGWQAAVDWRDRRYDVVAELVSFDPGTGYAIESRFGGVVSLAVVDLVALARGKTRLFVSVDLTPTSLSSRLLIQSLRLTKGSLTKRFKTRVAGLADEIRADGGPA